MRKKAEIWVKVAGKETFLETCASKEMAELRTARYYREDKRELAEGYGFPQGMPEYIIK